jgi:exodeoxyribonuclease VII small subunit
VYVPATVARTPSPKPDFEQALAELEQLAARLESGELPLDQALATFEQGVKLTRRCQTALQAAQQRVQILTRQGDTARLEEFDPDAGPASDDED